MATKKSSTKKSAKKSAKKKTTKPPDLHLLLWDLARPLNKLLPPSQECLDECYSAYQACLMPATIRGTETELQKNMRETACFQAYTTCIVSCAGLARTVKVMPAKVGVFNK